MRLATNRTNVMMSPITRTITRRRLFLLTLDPPECLLSASFPLMYAIGGTPVDLFIQRRTNAMITRITRMTIDAMTAPSIPSSGSCGTVTISPANANIPPSVPLYSIPSTKTGEDMVYWSISDGRWTCPMMSPSRSMTKTFPGLSYWVA